jgi:long-chain acyl-CoA synthetase
MTPYQCSTGSGDREKYLGIWQTWTWSQVAEEVRAIACGLAELGFKRGDNLAIIGDNRPRLYWSMCAAQCLGGVPVMMYQDAVAAGDGLRAAGCEIRFAIVEDQEQVDKMLEIKIQCPARAHPLRRSARHAPLHPDLAAGPGRSAWRWGASTTRTSPDFPRRRDRQGRPEDVAVMLYTSGTTGKPKGVCQTHDAFIAARAAASVRQADRPGGHPVLPADGLGGRPPVLLRQALVAGFTINCPESGETVMTDLREIGPTYYFAPPRVFENLLTR